MARCILLAKNGLGSTFPNPMVGSVIVHNNKIIGEGWHQKSGQPHAEVNAIASVTNKALLNEATIYVSLEPCSHFGKTPPCADLIIDSGIKHIIIGSKDPNPKVSGRGINKLTVANIDVIEGILTEECNELNKRFFSFHRKKRPYIILKWAETRDGFIAPSPKKRSDNKQPYWITNEHSRQFSHKLRAQEQAILVGTQTVLDDNPSLTTRDWQGTNPLRIVLDKSLKISRSATVFDDSAKTIVITEKNFSNFGQVIFEKIDFSENVASQICDILYEHEIQSVIIEGGAKTIQTFIDANLWDEAFKLKGNISFGTGIKAPKLFGRQTSEEKIKDDIVQQFKNNTP